MNVADERVRRSNILWTVKERLEAEAHSCGNWAKEDIAKALSANDDDMGRFFAYFAGSKAREAASFASMALDYKERIDKLNSGGDA